MLIILAACPLFFINDLTTQFWWLLGISTAINACGATEDVAVDGLAIAILPEDERGRANAFMAGGQIGGISITGAVSNSLLNYGGLPAVAFFLISVVGVLLAISIAIRERQGERFLPWSPGESHPDTPLAEGSALSRTKDLAKALVLPMSLIMISVAFVSRISDGFIEVWGPELAIKELGYSDETYARWLSAAYLVGAAVGLAFGPVIDKIGALKAFRISLLFNAALFCFFYLNADRLAYPKIAVTVLMVSQLGGVLIFISSIALFMSLCRIKISTTQFACYMAIFNLGKSFGAYIYPKVSYITGLEGIFWAMGAIFGLSWLISQFFNLETHKLHLAKLENS